MKIDCEGCEFDVLKSEDDIFLQKVKKIVLEYHPRKNHCVRDIVRVLKKGSFLVHTYSRKEIEGIGLLTAERL